ncbi:MAG: ABC transporter ATP-binding protein [Myxococcota bacterium]
MTAVTFKGVGKRYGDTVAVRSLDLQIAEGETFALVGESGSGKTTALRLINRLVEASSGTIEVFGEDIRSVDAPTLRRRIGYVIQGAGLFAHLTVRGNVAVVPGLLGWDKERTAARVDSLLERVGLAPAEYGDRFVAELSGGQRQRVGIARALAADPSLVLLDEPFGALDPVTREEMQLEFLELSRKLGKTFVIVTHDLQEAVRLGHRIGVMKHGEMVRVGTPAEVVSDPGHPFVAAMLGKNRLQLRLMTTPLSELSGGVVDGSVADDTPVLQHTDSVWDALTACEGGVCDGVIVHGDAQPRFIARQSLAAVTSAPGGVIR